MADFQEQVMGITGLTIDNSSTTPSRAEFSTFLNDGVIDVTNKWLVGHIGDRDQFTRVSALQVADATLDLNGAKIISVVRADSITAGNFRPCRKISPALQSQVKDADSLSFASAYYPAYMIDDNGKISVFPVAADNSGKDSFKVYYINNSPEETDGTALDHASTGIKYFPSDKIYLVILYAAIQSLKAAAGNQAILEDTELVNTYLGLANSLTSEYNSAFQIQQPAGQSARQPAARQQRR